MRSRSPLAATAVGIGLLAVPPAQADLLKPLTLDDMAIFLTEHAGDCEVGGAAYFLVDDVDALFREVHARSVIRPTPPEDTPWGTREMKIVDPDGNRLRFGGAAS